MNPRDTFKKNLNVCAAEHDKLKQIALKEIESLTEEEKNLIKNPLSTEEFEAFEKSLVNLASFYQDEKTRSRLANTEKTRYEDLKFNANITIDILSYRALQLHDPSHRSFLDLFIFLKTQKYPILNLKQSQASTSSVESSSSACIMKSMPSTGGPQETKSSDYSPSSTAPSTVSSEAASVTSTSTACNNSQEKEAPEFTFRRMRKG